VCDLKTSTIRWPRTDLGGGFTENRKSTDGLQVVATKFHPTRFVPVRQSQSCTDLRHPEL
jgi:hypothetical protein